MDIINRIYKNPILLAAVALLPFLLVFGYIFSSPPTAQSKTMKQVQELGRIPGTFNGYIYKIRIDSVDYIVVTKGEAVSIVKH